jgi:hypothetical protein
MPGTDILTCRLKITLKEAESATLQKPQLKHNQEVIDLWTRN